MKILVAFDGSPTAKRAMDEAVRLARSFEASLLLAYVVPPLTPVLDQYSVVGLVELQEQLRETGEQMLKAQADQLRREGLVVETVVKEGLPADRLAELAHQAQVSYVVVGASGHGAVARALLGGVVSKLLHLCNQTVVVVH